MAGALLAEWRKTLRPSTVWTYRNELRHLCNALHQLGAPTIQMPRLPRPKPRAVTATPEELAKLFKDPPAWLRLFQFLYFQCGMRLSEALAVTPRSWNREQRTVTVRVKGGAHRTVTITADVENLFLSAGNPDPDEPFIFTLKGRSITARGLEAAWQTWRKKCGVNPALTPHDLRRTAASIIYPATKDLRAVQELLGHKNLVSTLSYIAPLHPDDARKYAELLRFDNFQSPVKQ
jgi:site-specific recombinase XerC